MQLPGSNATHVNDTSLDPTTAANENQQRLRANSPPPSGKFITSETLTVDGGGQLWGETWTTGKPPYFRGDG
jgi:hypothetical protein